MSDSNSLNPQRGAPLWRRFMSMVYDSFLLGALTMAYGALVTLLLVLLQGDTTDGIYKPMIHSQWGNALYLLGLLLTLLGFYVYFWQRAGQTAGMRAWRLRVIDVRALPRQTCAGFGQCVKRVALSLPAFVFLGIGYWWRFFDPDKDCLHDRWSKTRVVLTPPRKKSRQ